MSARRPPPAAEPAFAGLRLSDATAFACGALFTVWLAVVLMLPGTTDAWLATAAFALAVLVHVGVRRRRA